MVGVDLVIELHELSRIDDSLLKLTKGKKDMAKMTKKFQAALPNTFPATNLHNAYSFFKTHKILLEALPNNVVESIPVRLLQSAGNITASRITAYVESILQPVSIKFCNFKSRNIA